MKNRNVKWHKMTAEAAVAQLHTNAACGLSRKAARSRCRKLGFNTLFDTAKNGRWAVWKTLLVDPSVLLLLFSVFLAIFFSNLSQVIAALITLLISVIAAFFLTGKIIHTHQIVSQYRVPTVFVLREGHLYEISARNIVPGDILLLQKGDIVPADCRVLETDGELCTRLIFRDGKGKRTAIEQIKRSDIVYPYESTVFAPNCENIIYGKSEIVRGSARVMVTEVGEYTFMGAMQQPLSVAKEEALTLKKSLCDVYPYFRVYSLFLFVLLIPMTAIGLLTAPADQGAMRTFLPLGILCGLGAPGLLLLFFHVFFADGFLRCVRPHDQRVKRVIPKSIDAMEKLSGVTDLIVLGRCASSDGIMHLHRASLGNGEVSLDTDVEVALAPICEAYELLFSAPSVSSTMTQQHSTLQNLEDPALREELRKISQYDLDILDIRLKRATSYYEKDRILLEVEFKDKHVRYCFTDRSNLLYSCNEYELNGQIQPLDGISRANLLRFMKSSISEGGYPTIVIKQIDGRAVLLGIISCREAIQSDIPSIVEELKQSGVRVSFFLPNDNEETRSYARVAALSDKICAVSDINHEKDFFECFETNRVFLGFSEKDIRALIRVYRKKGCKFAVLASETEAIAVQSDADLRISCDPLTADLKKTNSILSGSALIEQGFFDGQYSRSLSAHANILLPRAEKNGGGLNSFLHAFFVSRAVHYRMLLFLKYLLTAQLFRVSMIFCGAILGTGLLSGAQLLWSGLVFDSVVLLWILRIPIAQSRLRVRHRIDEACIEKLITDKRNSLSLIMTAVVFCLYMFVFRCIGLIDASEAVSLAFFSTIFIELMVFYQIFFEEKIRLPFKKNIIPILIIMVPILLVLGLSFLVVGIADGGELASFSMFSLLSLPLAPVLYLLFRKLAPRIKFRRKKSNK